MHGGRLGISRRQQSVNVKGGTCATDNGVETYTWPDGGMTPFVGEKGLLERPGNESFQPSQVPQRCHKPR